MGKDSSDLLLNEGSNGGEKAELSNGAEHDGGRNGKELKKRTDLLLVADTPKGRGVFASQPIPSGTVLDTCPVLILPPSEVEQHTRHTTLNHYTYNWPLPPYHPLHPNPSSGADALKSSAVTTQALILGLGSMFNHSSVAQNVGWIRDVANEVVIYKTLRDVQAGEELCISYGPPEHLTFVDVEGEARMAEDRAEEEREQAEGGDGVLGRIMLD